jgi:hypothetical protein
MDRAYLKVQFHWKIMEVLHGTLPFDKMKVNKDDKIIIKLKGDGKKYELRKKTIQVIITPTSALSTLGTGKK